MSDEITTEDDTTESQVPQELEEGRNSLTSGDQRAPGSGDERKGSKSTSAGSVTEKINLKFKLYNPKGPFSHSISLMLCMTSVLMDPLFLYLPEIKDDQKCFKLQNRWWQSAISLSLLIHMIYGTYALLPTVADFHNNPNIVGTSLFYLVDAVLTFPLSLVLVVHVYREKMRGTSFLKAMNVFVAQHVLRIMRLYTLFRKAKTGGNLAGWAKVAFNLSYFHAALVIGALWYFYAVTRQTVCWRKACSINQSGCDRISFYCNENSVKFPFSNDFCSKNTQNTTAYDFGIFRDAIQSGVLVESNLFKRFIACFRWGLQSLSCFGQGLSLSTNLLENVFVMSITISGVVLFFFLIGKVQMYVQSETVKSEERSQKIHELNRWEPFQKIDSKGQDQVKRYQSQEYRKTRDINVEYFLNNLPGSIRGDIQRQLCLKLLSSVDEFRSFSDRALAKLCDHVRPVFYTERSYIIRADQPIDQMLFVLQGELWTYTSTSTSTCTFRSGAGSSSSAAYNNSNPLDGGKLWVRELANWARMSNHDSANLPISKRTIQALTNVEAFVLLAGDLGKVVWAFCPWAGTESVQVS